MEDNAIIKLNNIVFNYDGENILDGINLEIKDKEFLTLLGPSGCGKTTTLRLIGGFIFPNSGNIYFNNQKINDLPPYKRKVNTVFQRYALFLHLNVFENVAFGLKLKKLPKKEIKKRVYEMLEIVNLKGFEKRKPHQLSGGQQQRVAIARALVNYPRVLLLDEPLGALDLKLRKEMQIELKNIQKKLGITFIYVTHDQEEALSMSDRIVVMNDGEIQQIGTAKDIYNEPQNAFVADFIGESNIIDGIMIKDMLVSFADCEFECVDKGFKDNQPVDVVIRPEDIKIVSKDVSKLNGIVDSVIFKGVHYEIIITSNNLQWIIHSTKNAKMGSNVGITFEPEDIHIMEKMFKYDNNYIKGKVIRKNTVEFMGIHFKRENLKLQVGSDIQVVIDPLSIEIVSIDHADYIGYLESLIYKGAYNELLVYTDYEKIMVYSQNEEQIGTEIGLKFNFDKIKIRPLKNKGDDNIEK